MGWAGCRSPSYTVSGLSAFSRSGCIAFRAGPFEAGLYSCRRICWARGGPGRGCHTTYGVGYPSGDSCCRANAGPWRGHIPGRKIAGNSRRLSGGLALRPGGYSGRCGF